MFMKLLQWFLALFRTEASTPPKPEIQPDTNPEVPAVETPKVNKRALLVGINDCGLPGAELNGCVNDVEAMWELLVEKFGFDPDNIRVLTDSRAPKYEILKRVQWLVEGAAPGDQLFYHQSSHGSQIRDRNGDELDDGMDEILISYEHSWDDPLKDDDLAEILKGLPEGAVLTVVIDACHSGSMTRGLDNLVSDNPGHKIKNRFLAPPVDIAARSWGRKLPTRMFGAKKGVSKGVDDQRHILISGCEDHQTSADALVDGRWGGALSTNLIEVLREHPDWDWNHIHEEVVKKVRAGGYTQNPQMTGMLSLRERVPFGGAQ